MPLLHERRRGISAAMHFFDGGHRAHYSRDQHGQDKNREHSLSDADPFCRIRSGRNIAVAHRQCGDRAEVKGGERTRHLRVLVRRFFTWQNLHVDR